MVDVSIEVIEGWSVPCSGGLISESISLYIIYFQARKRCFGKFGILMKLKKHVRELVGQGIGLGGNGWLQMMWRCDQSQHKVSEMTRSRAVDAVKVTI